MKTKSIKSRIGKEAANQTVKNIRRAARKLYSTGKRERIATSEISVFRVQEIM